MKIYVIKRTTKRGSSELEAYRTEEKAKAIAKSKNQFGKYKGETYEVIIREVADGTVLPAYS